jgi:hypothetical protein
MHLVVKPCCKLSSISASKPEMTVLKCHYCVRGSVAVIH